MTTLLDDQIESGDVLSALVLLASDTAVILDACDGSTPFVVTRDEPIDYRKFVPAL